MTTPQIDCEVLGLGEMIQVDVAGSDEIWSVQSNNIDTRVETKYD